MSASEIRLHARKKLRQVADARRSWRPRGLALVSKGVFPILPTPEDAPSPLREALRQDGDAILRGRWRFFGAFDLDVDTPPRWQRDYAVGADLATTVSSFSLDHRRLPSGADIKLIWELSRWSHLVRLAMAGYVLRDGLARRTVVEWLEDWVEHNPPYTGWNWTSALEGGIRLVQLTWLDELLTAPTWSDFEADSAALSARLERLREALLPAHLWFVWRHRSFGSSANNHLIGEVTGCLLAVLRWPELARLGPSVDELRDCWEREVLSQFAADGGNREQALNYHLFSFELCWQALTGLERAGWHDRHGVRARLERAAGFFPAVQATDDPWDYGDSDGAYVTPVFLRHPVGEWSAWMRSRTGRTAIHYWLGPGPGLDPGDPSPRARTPLVIGAWQLFPETGIATCSVTPWWLRWDLSPLGYLSTAAHGHLDALHLSIWCHGVALVVDPGTGAYYANPGLRAWLASRAAHNGPCPHGAEYPRRLGPFLWEAHHEVPTLVSDAVGVTGTVRLPGMRLARRVTCSPDRVWDVRDECTDLTGAGRPFTVRWQFAPDSAIDRASDREFVVRRRQVAVHVSVSADWAAVELLVPDAPSTKSLHAGPGSMEGIVSPGFRQVCRAPLLKLTAQPPVGRPGDFRTTFFVR